MKKGIIGLYIILIIINFSLLNFISAQTTLSFSLNAHNAPYEYLGVKQDHTDPLAQVSCAIPPMKVAEGLVPGNILNISQMSGSLCPRYWPRRYPAGHPKQYQNLYCGSIVTTCIDQKVVGDVSISCNHPNIKLAFYDNTPTTPIRIAEHTITEFFSAGVAVPIGANSIYAYYKEDPTTYFDNNGYQRCTYFYNLTTCTPKTCTNIINGGNALCGTYQDGCGGQITCGGCDIATQACNLTTGRCYNKPANPLICTQDQIIMRLFSESNSHGALTNRSEYSELVCFSEIFKDNYLGKEFNNCTSTNSPVVYLNDEINAHASTTKDAVYKVPVCYGDLVCIAKNSNCNEATEGNLTLYLSSNSNAHIAKANYLGGDYPIRICCKHNSNGGVGSSHWSDLLDYTTTLSITNIGNTVALIFDKPGIENEMVNYTIYKEGTLGWNPFNWFDRKIAQISGRGFTTWRADDTGRFKFIATIESTGQSSESNVLDVLPIYNNVAPTTRIVTPLYDENFTLKKELPLDKTREISFTHSSRDASDLLNITWDFGDNNITTYIDHADGLPGMQKGNVTHNYKTSGTKVIIITAKEKIRGQLAQDDVRIHVFQEGLGMHVFIDSPPNQSSIGSGSFLISGNRTYVSNCTRNGINSDQVSDNCNIDQNYKSANGYISDHGDCFRPANDDIMWCYKYASVYTGTGSDINRNKFNFTWTFDKGTDIEIIDNIHYNGDTFTQIFTSPPQKHSINLKVIYKIS
ncbi:MAG: hypothetical protein WC867_02075 [Candidatus Pacearchaeota archaeon]